MVTINNFEIINNGTQLTIDVSTNPGSQIKSVLLWSMDKYKDYDEAYDLSSLLEQINEREVLIINSVDIGINAFKDIWFTEIESTFISEDDCIGCDAPALGITYNLLPYYECMLDSLLKNGLNDCFNCNNKIDQEFAITINLFIDTAIKSLDLGYYVQAVDLIKKLQKLCPTNSCTECKPVTCESCSQFKQIS